MTKLLVLKFLILLFIHSNAMSKSELNIVGNASFSDGLGRLPISLMNAIHKYVNINFIHSTERQINFNEIPQPARKIIKQSANTGSYISILFDAPWHIYGEPFKKIPNCKIKYAYSMLEASLIPKKWVYIFNNFFDGVIVPDDSLINVYRKSGVKVPIFMVPCVLLLDDFLKQPIHKKSSGKFTFGISAAYGVEKNHDILIKAFANEFKNNEKFHLMVHGRWGNTDHLKKLINELNLKNVTLIEKIMTQEEYINYLKSLDCYVLLSRGEGFSITPREALALGIPCILSNNSAQKTICNTGFVRPVESEIKTPIFYKAFNADCGHQLTCTVHDAQWALREVYENYNAYLVKAAQGREWVKQYLPDNLKDKYINLIKPRKIILGNKNEVTKEYLMTKSKKLYEKYLNLQKK